ncbi:methylated-DNA--[protein]-cysteine S-methyltransferase [Salicibibacter cibarius]|uniref:methylated-DNA--[protein]-cysteine S-methyltransferase n=1 Tax=Salicibibacter cibarius TaxID=2743000 RepID=A0A7T6YZX8_9BACI|nr:methylated-DNA--[protein]-cysteine S-methyltransferase [Salicibibacter cibarius]QQK74415.1 methylated-DNA--[protein]-cysteine S-methyltransferase [Salicibibacter cibarius]
MSDRIYWSSVKYGSWRFYLAATEKGLCYISSPNRSFEELEAWANRAFGEYHLVEDASVLYPYVKELEEYFHGQRQAFSFTVDMHGTAFQCDVWETLNCIGFGETLSYSQVAGRMGKPKAVRAVASAIGANPVLIVTPCHRVIGKDGSLAGYRGGFEMKQFLLEMERHAK